MTKKNTKSSKKSSIREEKSKKRGRHPKKFIDDEDYDTEENEEVEDNSSVILKLNIDPNKFPDKPTKQKSGFHNNAIFENDIPKDKECKKCAKLDDKIDKLKTQMEKYGKLADKNKVNKIRETKLNLIDIKGKKVKLRKTEIKCWWDCESFDNLPAFLVENIQLNSDNQEEYIVRGCFCSFNCALAYNTYIIRDSQSSERKSLTLKLYRAMFDININDAEEVKEALPRECLESFTGKDGMTIEEFRDNLICLDTEYVVYTPPIKPISMYIEERYINNTLDNKKHVLKRTKPLSKKGSIIDAMQMKDD